MQKENQRILSHFETSEMRISRELPGASPPGPLPRRCPGPVEGLLTASPDPSCFRQRPLAIACVPSGRHVHKEQQDTIFKNFLHAPEKNPPPSFLELAPPLSNGTKISSFSFSIRGGILSKVDAFLYLVSIIHH